MLDYITFDLLAQLLINGILFGTSYGLAAIGLSLIFGTMRIIFLSQGAIIILMSYFCYSLFASLTIDPYVSILILVPGSLLSVRGSTTCFFEGPRQWRTRTSLY